MVNELFGLPKSHCWLFTSPIFHLAVIRYCAIVLGSMSMRSNNIIVFLSGNVPYTYDNLANLLSNLPVIFHSSFHVILACFAPPWRCASLKFPSFLILSLSQFVATLSREAGDRRVRLGLGLG